MNSAEFEFVDELPEPTRHNNAGRGGNKTTARFADALRSSPGRWAKYPHELKVNSKRTVAAAINNGSRLAPAALRGDQGFRAAVRQGELYVAWFYTDSVSASREGTQ
ncbi:hypothetical protein [Mycolicibacter kumamotonensis]|uniref:Uncharacterized protein n=1 Tax=Mycolicibacter kumamotonensis TaxID=354243 RepID=A0A1B8SLA4_9MYCO|nr:hypothetical protein [Mycolicibacter kumamotonensis]OBY33470.1 hypothetical protein ACT18_00535 [Mycolicibacter kumamotonensis]